MSTVAEKLKNMMDKQVPTWFAIHQNAEDTDDGTGSLDPEEAAEMAVEEDAYSIVLIYQFSQNTPTEQLYQSGMNGSEANAIIQFAIIQVRKKFRAFARINIWKLT